jgi:transposase
VLVLAVREELIMDVVVARCAGLDVHRDTVVATVRVAGKGRARARVETRTFSTMGAGLLALGDWLEACGVRLVGMESTGVYWKAPYYLLEDRFECWLLNPQHMRNVPGRKTDVADSVWIAELLAHGLVRPSAVPPRPIRDLRDLTRYRRRLVEARTREVQRLDKLMQDAGIKLTSVSSRLLTKSGLAMIEAMLAGESDPLVLAELAQGRLRSKIPELRQALAGRFRVGHHGLLARRMLAHIRFLEAGIADLDTQIDRLIIPFEPMLELVMTIPGVDRVVGICLIAEIGVDMTIFPTAGHLASWAGICPGNNASGGRRRNGRTRRGPMWLRTALTEAAHAAARAKGTYLAAHHAQVRGRRGTPKAIGATRHDILTVYWHILAVGTPYHDLGPDWNRTPKALDAQARRLVAQLEALGKKVTIADAA